ncbi:MAG: transcriptional regulator [Pirellulales bacterium]|nr:transcriptional regulator [Pirellulales bacterium]
MCAKRAKPTPGSAMPPSPQDAGADYDFAGLDRTLHEKARLGIVLALAKAPAGLVFGDLKRLCGLTDGNLSRHLKTLTDAQFVEAWKGYRDNYPQTLLRLTPLGNSRFQQYLAELERVLQTATQTQAVVAPAPLPHRPRLA